MTAIAYPTEVRPPAAASPDGVTAPDREGFRRLAAAGGVVPVVRHLLADGETPVGLYRRLAGGPRTFLLESAEHGRSWSRWSFVGARCPAVLVERDGRAVWEGDVPAGVPDPGDGDPVDGLRTVLAALASPPRPGLPPLTGGLVGALAYDLVRHLERLPALAEDDLGVPDLQLLLALDVAVLDHHDGSVLLVANAVPPRGGPGGAYPAGDEAAPDLPAPDLGAVDAAYEDAVSRLDAMERRLAEPLPGTAASLPPAAPPRPRLRTPAGRFPDAVRAGQRHVRDGDVFQVNLAQRFELETDASALDVYRVLRATNPSPYMYLLRLDDMDVVGSSPETHLRVDGRRAMLKPIAGTKPRGATPAEDAAHAADLLGDPKERAEHVMLVDLARNDLGRVCRPGTVDVADFFAVERYSHVMHIVSRVEGELAPGTSTVDALAATFPAGTLTGAPKVRAMEVIDSQEPTRRGLYAGTCGYLDFSGGCDMAITIRTAVLAGGVAHVQAGAGVVDESVPDSEDRESHHKAAAVLQAVARAGALRPAGVPPG